MLDYLTTRWADAGVTALSSVSGLLVGAVIVRGALRVQVTRRVGHDLDPYAVLADAAGSAARLMTGMVERSRAATPSPDWSPRWAR